MTQPATTILSRGANGSSRRKNGDGDTIDAHSDCDALRQLRVIPPVAPRTAAGTSALDRAPQGAAARPVGRADEAGEAIAIWEHDPAESRSLDDEALAQVYQATAYLQLGQLDAATAAVRPIFDLPVERQIQTLLA